MTGIWDLIHSIESPPTPPFVGGCILFDGNGRVIVRQYGFQMSLPGGGASNLCLMLGTAYPAANLIATSGTVKNTVVGSYAFIPSVVSASALNTTPPSYPAGALKTAPYSQVGLVLFDYDSFKSQGFSDLDADINGVALRNARKRYRPASVRTGGRDLDRPEQHPGFDQSFQRHADPR